MKTKQASLTSEERCRKAFEEWYGGQQKTRGRVEENYLEEIIAEFCRRSWFACWEHLESRVTEFIEN